LTQNAPETVCWLDSLRPTGEAHDSAPQMPSLDLGMGSRDKKRHLGKRETSCHTGTFF